MSTSVLAIAQEEGEDPVRVGFDTYSVQCAGCHQAGGVGISGTFPPLNDNPRVQDTDYLVTTILNGKQGAITVDGVDYDGVMPAFSTLGDAQIEGLVAYIQGGFAAPADTVTDTASELPLATGTLPELSGMAIVAAFAIAIAAGAFVLAPKVIATTDRISMPWLDAWLRAGIIVVFFVVATVFVPSMIMQTETVGRLARPVQDVIGSGLWIGGLLAGLAGLWWAHRDNRI
jgi:mono/diheme cytochrome c family protein